MITRINYNCTELINSLYWELIENDVINTHGGDKAYEIKQPLGIVKYTIVKYTLDVMNQVNQ